MSSIPYFRMDNTEGYTQQQLDELNRRHAERKVEQLYNASDQPRGYRNYFRLAQDC